MNELQRYEDRRRDWEKRIEDVLIEISQETDENGVRLCVDSNPAILALNHLLADVDAMRKSRNYRTKFVQDVSSEELLFELIKRNKLDIAPLKTEYHGEWLQANIAIGPDSAASIMLDGESYEKLMEVAVTWNEAKQEAYY